MSSKFLVKFLALNPLHKTVIKHDSINDFCNFHALISRTQEYSSFSKVFDLIPRLMQRKADKSKNFYKSFYYMQDRLVTKRRLFLSQDSECD